MGYLFSQDGFHLFDLSISLEKSSIHCSHTRYEVSSSPFEDLLLGPEDEKEEASLSRSSSSLSFEERSCEEKLSTEEEAFLFALLSLLEWNFPRYSPIALLASFLKSYYSLKMIMTVP